MPKVQSKKKSEDVEYVGVNEKFLEQFVAENKLTMDFKFNCPDIVKSSKSENSVKNAVSQYIIDELVRRMNLQYDKKDILETEVPEFLEEKILPKDGVTEGMNEKETYKCVLTYKPYLS